MLVAQISDCHVMAPGELFGGRLDSSVGARAAVDAIDALPTRPDLVLATGDLVNDGRPAQYEHLMEILSDLDVPIVPVVGNHDDRPEFRRRFAGRVPDGRPDDPIDHVVDVAGRDGDGLGFVVLDTPVPGRHAGRLSPDQLAALGEWFDAYRADEWDRQIEADAKAGRLDALISEAQADIAAGRIRPLP